MQLTCPCGELIEAANEDELVDAAQRHLGEVHPDRTYTRDQILFLADG